MERCNGGVNACAWAKNGSSLPGTVVRKEGDAATADAAVNEAYDGSGVTYDLFNEVYRRNSIDANGMRLDSTVHYRTGYDNAFWDGINKPHQYTSFLLKFQSGSLIRDLSSRARAISHGPRAHGDEWHRLPCH